MKLVSESISGRIAETYAMGVPGPQGPQPGPNKSPHLAWSEVPEGTRSFVLICHDPDVPSRPDDVNQPDRTVPYDLPRVDFFHWVLVDIPANRRELAEGEDSDGVTPRGKPYGPTDHGVRGLNSYSDWFAGDPVMEGDYGGYDGPWPPFNDERLHHYHYTIYALDLPSLEMGSRFTGPEVRDAMRGHVLDQAAIVGSYALYPDAR